MSQPALKMAIMKYRPAAYSADQSATAPSGSVAILDTRVEDGDSTLYPHTTPGSQISSAFTLQ